MLSQSLISTSKLIRRSDLIVVTMDRERKKAHFPFISDRKFDQSDNAFSSLSHLFTCLYSPEPWKSGQLELWRQRPGSSVGAEVPGGGQVITSPPLGDTVQLGSGHISLPASEF